MRDRVVRDPCPVSSGLPPLAIRGVWQMIDAGHTERDQRICQRFHIGRPIEHTSLGAKLERLPVVAARISEDIPEQTGLLQAEVARLTS